MTYTTEVRILATTAIALALFSITIGAIWTMSPWAWPLDAFALLVSIPVLVATTKRS